MDRRDKRGIGWEKSMCLVESYDDINSKINQAESIIIANGNHSEAYEQNTVLTPLCGQK